MYIVLLLWDKDTKENNSTKKMHFFLACIIHINFWIASFLAMTTSRSVIARNEAIQTNSIGCSRI